jgi:hypothetical protein
MIAKDVKEHIRTLQKLLGSKKAVRDQLIKGAVEVTSFECGYLQGVADCYNVDVLELVKKVKG